MSGSSGREGREEGEESPQLEPRGDRGLSEPPPADRSEERAASEPLTQRQSPCLTPAGRPAPPPTGTPQGSAGSRSSGAALFDVSDQAGSAPPRAAVLLLQAGEKAAPFCVKLAAAGERVCVNLGVVSSATESVPGPLRRDFFLVWWALLGFGLAFFGRSSFWGLVVLIEALLLCGAKEARDHVRQLFGGLKSGGDTEGGWSRDDYEHQLAVTLAEPEERAKQRMESCLSAVRDPDKLPLLLRTLLLIAVGVVAAVRWQGLRDLVLGCGIARSLRRPCGRAVSTVAYHVLPDRHQRYLTVVTDAALVTGFVLLCAFGLHDGGVAVCAGLRGAPLLVGNVSKLLRVRQVVSDSHLQAAKLSHAEYFVAAFGASCQFALSLHMPGMLWVLLFPAKLASSAVQGLS